MTTLAAVASYTPVDELLDRRLVRILRAISHFDWATSREISLVLDVPSDDWGAHTAEVSRMHRGGLLERRGDRCSFEYRITARGRRELAALLDRSRL